jgi:hypothetical protein
VNRSRGVIYCAPFLPQKNLFVDHTLYSLSVLLYDLIIYSPIPPPEVAAHTKIIKSPDTPPNPPQTKSLIPLLIKQEITGKSN